MRINIFFSYQNNPEIVAMVNLIDAYQHNEITRFEEILNTNKEVDSHVLPQGLVMTSSSKLWMILSWQTIFKICCEAYVLKL